MRKTSDSPRRGRVAAVSGAAALALAAALPLAGCGDGEGEAVPVKPGEEVRIDSSAAKTYRTDFGPFALLAEPEFGGETLDAKLVFDEREVDASARGFVIFNPRAEVRDFPLPGCRTLPVEMYSGGANCCFTYYILTTCTDDSVSYASYIDANGKSSMGNPETLENGTASLVFPISDPAFQYYQPRGQSDENPLFLSGADSPALTRFLIFDETIWRPDQAGRHQEAYDILIAQVRNAADMHPAARAIAIAYYTAMKGDESLEVLEELLPVDWAPYKELINADILDAIENFEPVHTIDLIKHP
ncbi:hypothetical protein IHV25_00025 [Phaeovibrio sulfidiphilus]|uniref:Lipoprotein n=1 Tax=Phaeovibrio sulfidiphilus TaxID=1220600 RepID=A0A8J7CV98_9PROT|nr:hypothetical protein [Phaeovibrio sulfidiphilus]MBE1236046.1 hypothetical protein [Phaeovibrio sulfidiphilus]